VVGAIGLLLAVGCGGDDGPSGPVKVGLLAPKTGALMQVGESFERVALVAVASINDKGGVDGRDLELVVGDTETTAATAPIRLQALIDQDVIAVVGPATSGEVDMSYPIARDQRVPIISPSSTAPFLSRTTVNDGGYMFRNVPDDEIQGIAMAYYLKNLRNPMVMNVAVVFENSPYGMGLKDAFKTSFENLGGDVVTGGEIAFEQNLATDAAATPTIDMLVAMNRSPPWSS
jgi:branched-chain amino acid transport system substrate-binding protein